MKVLVPLANGFEDIEALTIVDVLRRGGVDVVTASIHSTLEVMSAHKIVVRADALFSDVGRTNYDAIILPGGGEGTENLKNSNQLIARLVQQREDGKLLCAICAAPTVLQEAGLLDDSHHVTCYPTCQLELDGVWVNEPVVVHDGFITSQAPGTAMIFSLVILEALAGKPVAEKVARGLVFRF